MNTATIDGKNMLRALNYSLKAAPKGEAQARLAHLVFHRRICGGKQAGIIAADGERWHIGYLPADGVPDEPFVVARESCMALRFSLEYARRMAKMRSTQFYVEFADDVVDIDGRPTRQLELCVSYGAKHPIIHPLALVSVGYIPETWSAPELPTDDASQIIEMRAQHLKEAQEWYRAWDKDHGITSPRWRGGKVAQLDIVSGGGLVASAFILSPTMPPAQLVLDEPLFERLHPGRKVGQSILDLQIDGDGEPAEAKKRLDVITIDGHEINARNVGDVDPEELILRGPCIHATPDGEPCWQCTTDNVKQARKSARAEKKAAQKLNVPSDGTAQA